MPKFTKMSRLEWEKPVSRSTTTRRDAFVDAVKAGDPVSDIEGNDVYIANTIDNFNALDNYLNNPSSGRNDFFNFTLKNGGVIQSNMIGKSAIFGGQGAGGGATGDTSRFESLHCLYIAAILGEGTNNELSHFTYETLKKYENKVSVSEPFEDYAVIDGDWHASAYQIAQALIKKKYVTSRHTLHRGDTVMKDIYDAKKRVRKLEGKPPIQDDKWNPGDIWAVKAGTNPKTIFSKIKTLDELNALILKHFIDRTIVGISLKKVKKDKRVKITDYNIEASSEEGKHVFSKITFETARGKDIWSSKYGFFYFDTSRQVEVRTPNIFSALNFELKGKGARAGRTGYGQIVYSAGAHLKKVLPTNAQIIAKAKVLAGTKPPEGVITEFFNLVKKIHPEINRIDFETQMKTKNAGFIHSLLAGAYVGAALMDSTKNQRDAFTSEVVNVMSAKTNDSSAYVKAEEA